MVTVVGASAQKAPSAKPFDCLTGNVITTFRTNSIHGGRHLDRVDLGYSAGSENARRRCLRWLARYLADTRLRSVWRVQRYCRKWRSGKVFQRYRTRQVNHLYSPASVPGYHVKVGVQTKPTKGTFQLAINGVSQGAVQDDVQCVSRLCRSGFRHGVFKFWQFFRKDCGPGRAGRSSP